MLGLATAVTGVPLLVGLPTPAQAASCPRPPLLGNHIGAVGWGDNFDGQVGNGASSGEVLSPVQVKGVTDNITRVAAGLRHSLAATRGGQVWAWGSNLSGQLGDGTTTDHATPVLVPGLGCIVQVAAGSRFSLALKADGTVWSWGSNASGQLGTGSASSFSATPVQIPGLTGVTQIVAGDFHGLAVRQDGTVWAWGANNRGQLGDATTTSRFTPVQVVGLNSASQIAAGDFSSYVLGAAGTVESWGSNVSGKLGIGTHDAVAHTLPEIIPTLGGVIQISAGPDHVLALKSDGAVSAWGANRSSQLGDAATGERDTPAQVPGVSGVTQVAAGSQASYALRSDRTLLAWGDNDVGQMGNGTISDPRPPSPVPGLTNVRWISAGDGFALAARFKAPAQAPPPSSHAVAGAADRLGSAGRVSR